MNAFHSQNLLVLGLAREGTVVCRWLSRQGARVIASDIRSAEQLSQVLPQLADANVELRLGPQNPDLLDGVDGVVVSPGVPQDIPLLQVARRCHIPISTETRLFARRCPAPIVGISGSSGKTTTTTLCARVLSTSGYKTWLGGNIGSPLLEELSTIQPAHRVVMELSSFQLLYWGPGPPATARPWHQPQGISPHISALLNITPNHLDRHPSMAHYIAAKAHLLAWQDNDDFAVLNLDDPLLGSWVDSGRVQIRAGIGQSAWEFPLTGQVLGFSLERTPSQAGAWLDGDRLMLRWQDRQQLLARTNEVRLRGRHNLANILAAACISAAAGADLAAMQEVIRSFTGVEHRLEEVRRLHGVLWINDSIATSPERAMAALRSFTEPVILLAGGRDKHLPWDQWASVVQQKVRHLITFGEAAPIIEAALMAHPAHAVPAIHRVPDLPTAVETAARLAREGDVVLLSPGGTSFDAYVDFAARGRHFRDLVNAL